MNQETTHIGQPAAMPVKKVLIIITKATWGGAQRYVYDLATHLPRDKYEPIVAFGQAGKLSNDLVTAGIETHQLSSLGRDIVLVSDIRSFFEIRRIIHEIRPDVVHLNSSKAAALGALTARLLGVEKIIFTVHGWPFKEKRGAFANKLIRMISWFTVALSHAVIVVSKTDLDIGKTFGGGVADKVQYIPIGIELLQFFTRDKAAASLAIATTTPRIVTIAELTANKGLRYAIEAVAELKKRGIDVSYFIIGEGEQREALQHLGQALNIVDRVHFLEFVPDASKYLKAFDIFLLPSVKEGTPYVLIEAEIAGLPIVATNVIDTFWTESGIVTLVPIASTSLLAQAIERAIKQPVEATVQPFSTLDKIFVQC